MAAHGDTSREQPCHAPCPFVGPRAARCGGSVSNWRATFARRRAEAIVLHATGLAATEIAEALGAHRNTIYADLHAFARHGVGCLATLRTGGAPRRISAARRTTILALADQPPAELGLPYGRWSLAKLRAFLLTHRVVRTISREHLRRLLQKGGCASGASAAS